MHEKQEDPTNHIEDIEADVLKGMAATLPPPRSANAESLREELIAFLHAARRLMARHPRVIFPPIGSAAWIAFSGLTIRWREALSAFARSEADVIAAWAALISYSSHDAELERTWGADYVRQSAEAILKHFGRSFRTAPDQTAFDLIVESIVNTMLPGLTRKGHKTARSPRQRLTENAR